MNSEPDWKLELDHTGIAVRSVEEGLAVWEHLGFRLIARERVESEGVDLGFLAGPGLIELLAPTGPGGSLVRFLESRGPGLHHIAYRVLDIRSAVAASRWEFPSGIRPGALGRQVAFAHPKSTGGVLIELVEGPSPLFHVEH